MLLIQMVVLGLVLVAGVCTLPARGEDAPWTKIAPGPYKADVETFKQYRYPDWFRDAKFGIWAHWGPQAVPMQGDWYAKHMYVQGQRQYKDHLEKYGHPSEHGYTEIIDLWKAEKFDPERLMALYKKAGAKYFVSMGTHHDNFFLWDSKIHRWNAVQKGPHRDIVGAWQAAAKKEGLYFGVSEHLGASFTWFQTSHGSDKEGPKAGVPYDGAKPELQDLYHFPAEPDDKGWYSKDPRWHAIWFNSIKELVDRYHPDLLYTDGGLPFGEPGAALVAHYYNTSAAEHGGKAEVVYTCKQSSEGRWVQDLERGVMAKGNPEPWQTDTSIGDWYYNVNYKFRPVSWTIHMLADIVAKNGNLLLNVVQRPDGSLDPEVEQALDELAKWIAVNGDAIYSTRPWQVYGEGPVRAKGGHFKEDFKYTHRDIRFTTKGEALYAIALGIPDDHALLIRSLAKPADGKGNAIESVSLLGHDGKIEWTQTAEGLRVTLPGKAPCAYSVSLKILGKDLAPVPFDDPGLLVTQSADGSLDLAVDMAEPHGKVQAEEKGGKPNFGFWDSGKDSVTWKVKVDEPGTFQVATETAGPNESALVVEAGGQSVTGTSVRTGGWDEFRPVTLGKLQIEKAGVCEIKVRPKDENAWKAINLRALKLTPVQ